MTFESDLDALLLRHAPAVADLTRELVATLADIRPELSANVQPGWGSVNFRHADAGFLCAVFPQTAGTVQLVFEHGRLLSSPLLQSGATTKQVRWITLAPEAEIPVDEIAILLAEAIALKS